MNRKQQSVVLAGLLALALAGCSSTKGTSDEMGGGATASGTGSSSTGSSGAGASMGSGAATGAPAGAPAGDTAATSGADSMAMPAQAPGMPGQATMPTAAPNAVVMTIEVMPRPSAAGAGSAAVGGSGTAGSTGSSSMGDGKMYRITLRMDDGTTRVVTQDKAPTFRNGDRVNMMDGMIAH